MFSDENLAWSFLFCFVILFRFTDLFAEQLDGEGVGNDHDDHGHVEGGQRAEEGEAVVVDDALFVDHDVTHVVQAQRRDGRADE